MLKKMLKYELYNNYKFLMVFYCLSFVFALLTKFFSIFDNSNFLMIISSICRGVTISMCFNIIINNLMRLWADFKMSFYGDRAYLVQTLPVKRETIFLSKIIFSILTMLVSIVVIAISLIISIYSKENFEILKVLIEKTINSFNISAFGFVLVITLLLFSQFLFILLSGYFGLILGFKRNDKKMGFSVLYAICFYFICQIVTLFLVFVISLFNKTIYSNLFNNPSIIDFWVLKFLIIFMICLYFVYSIVIYFVSQKILKKGVDVD